MGYKMKDELEKFKQYLIAQQITPEAYVKYMRVYFKFLILQKIEIKSGYLQNTVVKFLNTRNWKPSTRNLFLFSGRQYYHKYSISSETDSGFLKLKPTYIESKIPDFLDEEDLKNAIKYTLTYNPGLMNPTKLKALLTFLFFSGVRPGELLNLKRSDFEFNQDPIRIKIRLPVKRKKERYTYFPKKIYKILLDYFEFESERINAFNITKAQLRFLMEQIGIHLKKRVYSHVFRHSAARNWINMGMGVQIVQQLLGHASLKTTMIYTNPNEKMVKDIYKNCFNKSNKEVSQ
jgi:integrase